MPPLAIGSKPDTPVVRGSPVAFVKTADDGVPNAGVTKVGLVPKTTVLPVPVVVAAISWLDVFEPSTIAEAGTAPPLTFTTEVTKEPAEFVMSPVCAGSCAA